MSESIERKTFEFEVKAVAEDGTFKGYCSTWSVDLGGDQILKGAFAGSLKATKGVVPILWQHDQKQPIGWNLSAKEDDKGLYIEGELMTKDALAQKAREWMQLGLKVGGKVGLSIGYRVVDSAPGDKGVRLLKQLDLVEYSVVTWAMNQEATVTAVKAVVSYQDLPLAGEARGWDAGAARGRVKAWAGGDLAKYRRAFLWHDAAKPEDLSAYWFLIADVAGGKLLAIPRAIEAAATAASGVSLRKLLGETLIPDSDLADVKTHLGRYYKKLKKNSPFGGKMDRKEFKAEDFNASLAEAQAISELYDERWKMQSAICDVCEDAIEDDALSLDDKKAVIAESYQQYALAMASWWAKYIDLTVDEPEPEAAEAKAGRTLSANTISKMKDAIGMHAKAMDSYREGMKMHRKGIGQMHSILTYAGQYQADRNAPNPAGKPKTGASATEDQVRSLNDSLRKTRDALRAA